MRITLVPREPGRIPTSQKTQRKNASSTQKYFCSLSPYLTISASLEINKEGFAIGRKDR